MKNKKTTKYYFVVGEASGDLHASYLMQAISGLDRSSQFLGIGGEKMERLNFQSLVSIKNLNVMGFFEVFKRLPYFLKLKKKVVEDIKQKKPDRVILVDYPGFNLKLAKSIKKEVDVPIIIGTRLDENGDKVPLTKTARELFEEEAKDVNAMKVLEQCMGW